MKNLDYVILSYDQGHVTVTWVPSTNQLADIFTKAKNIGEHDFMRDCIMNLN